MSDLKSLPRPFFVLAPMDDVTDSVFRRVVGSLAPPDLYFTEFVNVDGLQSPGRSKLLKKLRFTADEQSLIAQIWGLKPENFYEITKQIANGSFAREFGLPEGVNYAGVDLNMGCPERHVVHNGACSALINDRELAGEIIQASREGLGGKLPLSIKTRTGFNQIDMTWFEFLLQHKLNMLTIHGRTKKEMSKVPADWDIIGEVKKLRDKLSPDTLIVGNGDIESRQQGLELAENYGLDGVMVGRGLFHDPFLFAENSPWDDLNKTQRIALYKKHVELFARTWKAGEHHVYTLNKFCKIYINGFDGAKEMREQLMAAKSTDELLGLLNQFEVV